MYNDDIQMSSIEVALSKDDKLICDNDSIDSLNKSLIKLNEKTTKMNTLPSDNKINKKKYRYKKIFKVKRVKKEPTNNIKTCDKETQTINYYEEEEMSDEEAVLEYLLNEKKMK